MGSLSPPQIRIAIAGGGIAGLTLARGLLQYPHLDVQVYEATPSYRDVGAGLTLHGNGIRAMECIDPAIKQAYFRKANSMLADDEREMATHVTMAEGRHRGKEVAELGRAKGRKTVARRDLLQGLVDLVPESRLHMGKRLERIEEGPDAVRLLFKDGTTAEADCLIGSDGANSATRVHLLGDVPEAYAVNHDHWYRIGREIPAEDVERVLPEKWTKAVPILCGSQGLFVVMPLRYGGVYSVGCNRRAPTKEDIGSIPSREIFSDYDEFVPKLFDLILEDLNPEDGIWEQNDHDPAGFYAKGNVVMIGDAAHCTGPAVGNGAAQAIEDAAALHAIFAHVQDKDQIPAAFLAFDETRRPRSQKVVEIARQMAQFYEYDYGNAWSQDRDLDELRALYMKNAAYTNNADIAQQNRNAVEAFHRLSKKR